MDLAYRDTYNALLLIMKNVAGHLPAGERTAIEEPLINAARSIPRLVTSGKAEDIEKAATFCNEAIVALTYCRDNHPQRVNRNVCNNIIEIYEHSLPLLAKEGSGEAGMLRKLLSLLLTSGVLLLIGCQPMDHHAKIAKSKIIPSPLVGEGQGEGVKLSPVHFPTGSDVFLDEELNVLDSNVAWLEKNPKAVLVLEGHCDERGGDRFNMQLGDRRARRIKSQLIAKGVASDRLIMVVSYGARAPLDPRHTPVAWNKNRRVEFIVR